MEDDDFPRRRSSEVSSEANLGAASLLASESLEPYSLDELDLRVALLESEIERIRTHRAKAAAHMEAANALFRPKQA